MEEKKELQKQDERVVEIELERLREFVNHPFKVQADSQMIELQESIKKYGILNPLIVRPRQDKVLRSCFRQAVKWDMMKKNPAVDATVPKAKKQEREIWTAEMLMQALEACRFSYILI